MPVFSFQQPIRQLARNKGGYFYFEIEKQIVDEFQNGKSTRILCTIDDQITLPCGFNHMGNGNFFLIVANRHLKKLNKVAGDEVTFEIKEDPNPLGVEIPEVLTVLLDQDPQLQQQFDGFTDGRKRTLIHSVNRVKNIDRQVEMAMEFFENEALKKRRSRKSTNHSG